MKRKALVLSVVALVFANAECGDVVKDDVAKLQGSWKLLQYVERGIGTHKDELEFIEVVFKGSNFEIKTPGGTGKKGTFKLDPAQKPPRIDLFGGDKKPAPGVYTFDGASLKICLPSGPNIIKGVRPTDFSSTKENGYTLMVLERKKN